MINQIAPVAVILIILTGQSVALLYQNAIVLIIAILIGGVITIIGARSKKNMDPPWYLIRIRELSRYLLLWGGFPILTFFMLTLGGIYAAVTLASVPLIVYVDMQLNDDQKHSS